MNFNIPKCIQDTGSKIYHNFLTYWKDIIKSMNLHTWIGEISNLVLKELKNHSFLFVRYCIVWAN